MSAPPIGWTTQATISRVIDGDTVEVDINRRLAIRLKDCWALESETLAGQKSTESLEKLLSRGQEVTLHIDGSRRDMVGDIITFSRFVGDIWRPGSTMSAVEYQLSGGHAYPTRAAQQAAQLASKDV